VWQEEAELYTIVLIDEENRLTIRGIFLFYDIGRNDFPLPVFEILPLIRPIGCDTEAGLNTSPLSQQLFQGTPMRSRATGFISCLLNHSWCGIEAS
jgi:hypothetical protein